MGGRFPGFSYLAPGGRRAVGPGASRALAFSRPMLNKAAFEEAPVPTLFRFLAVIAVLAGLVFAAMFALATFVEPQSRDMTVTIPFNRLQPK